MSCFVLGAVLFFEKYLWEEVYCIVCCRLIKLCPFSSDHYTFSSFRPHSVFQARVCFTWAQPWVLWQINLGLFCFSFSFWSMLFPFSLLWLLPVRVLPVLCSLSSIVQWHPVNRVVVVVLCAIYDCVLRCWGKIRRRRRRRRKNEMMMMMMRGKCCAFHWTQSQTVLENSL